jgi:hypothetical protein
MFSWLRARVAEGVAGTRDLPVGVAELRREAADA